jgi:hypothetical protein
MGSTHELSTSVSVSCQATRDATMGSRGAVLASALHRAESRLLVGVVVPTALCRSVRFPCAGPIAATAHTGTTLSLRSEGAVLLQAREQGRRY